MVHSPGLIPKTAQDLTATWLASVLADAGHSVAVAAVHATPIGTGQMASSIRLRVDYDTNDSDAPDSFVIKLASDDPNSRAAGARGAYEKEVRFYQELAPSLPVATPASFWSAINTQTHDFAIVLEDMHPAEQGDQIAGCGVDDVRTAAHNIAGLHAPFWNDHQLFEQGWLTAPVAERDATYREFQQLMSAFTPGFIERYRDRISAQEIDLLTWFAATADDFLRNDHGRVALMHGDHRLDNLLFNHEDADRPVTVVDWQTIAVRNPVADISYLVGTSMTPELRRDTEHDIVAGYHQRLCELGVTDYSLASCFDDYRAQTPHALILTVLGSMFTVQTDRGDDMFMAMLHRVSEQIADLDVR